MNIISQWTKKLAIALTVTATVAALIAAWYARQAYIEYHKSNRATVRNQLYATEREISESEMLKDDPLFRRIYCQPKSGATPEIAIREYLSVCAYGDPHKDFPEAKKINSASKLYDYIWSNESYTDQTADDFRRLYIHAERYLYHIQNGQDYADDGFITQAEWDTWTSVITEIGSNPIFLAALYSAEKDGFLTPNYAAVLQRLLSADPAKKAIIQSFYPEVFTPEWLANFSDIKAKSDKNGD